MYRAEGGRGFGAVGQVGSNGAVGVPGPQSAAALVLGGSHDLDRDNLKHKFEIQRTPSKLP